MQRILFIPIILLFFLAFNQVNAGTLGSVENPKWDEGEYQLMELLAATGTDEEVKAAYKKMILARMIH